MQKFAVELYMSPVETWCHNINYFIPDEEGITKDFPMEKMARIRKYKTYFSKNIFVYFFKIYITKSFLNRSSLRHFWFHFSRPAANVVAASFHNTFTYWVLHGFCQTYIRLSYRKSKDKHLKNILLHTDYKCRFILLCSVFFETLVKNSSDFVNIR